MTPTRITDRISVAGQPDPGEFAGLARAGFTGVINLRPDGEEPGQPGDAAERAAAVAAGLDYHFIPVTGPTITEADIRAFQAATARGVTLAHCKGGTRALTLYVLGQVLDGAMAAEEVEAFGRAHGHDLAGAVRWLARARG